jgi:uncharacterized membrane protein
MTMAWPRMKREARRDKCGGDAQHGNSNAECDAEPVGQLMQTHVVRSEQCSLVVTEYLAGLKTSHDMEQMMQQPPPLNSSIQNPSRENIEAVAQIERDALHRRNWAERFSEGTVRVVGSLSFLLLNALLMVGWTLVNLNLVPGIKPFDRFPFGILTLIVSAQGLILMIFVLMSQNRLMRQSEKRSHLDLQISLLTEQELTAVVQMLQKLCEHAGVKVDYSKHAEAFGEATDVHKIVKELDEKMPPE